MATAAEIDVKRAIQIALNYLYDALGDGDLSGVERKAVSVEEVEFDGDQGRWMITFSYPEPVIPGAPDLPDTRKVGHLFPLRKLKDVTFNSEDGRLVSIKFPE